MDFAILRKGIQLNTRSENDFLTKYTQKHSCSIMRSTCHTTAMLSCIGQLQKKSHHYVVVIWNRHLLQYYQVSTKSVGNQWFPND